MREALRSLIGKSNYRNLRRVYRKLRGLEIDEVIMPPNILTDQLIVCNLCGAVFPRSGPNHSEFLNCPNCGEIARDRVITQIILQEVYWRTKQWHPILSQTKTLKSYRILECSPRRNVTRQSILENTFLEYLASDFEMSSHQAEVKIDLTDASDIANVTVVQSDAIRWKVAKKKQDFQRNDLDEEQPGNLRIFPAKTQCSLNLNNLPSESWITCAETCAPT